MRAKKSYLSRDLQLEDLVDNFLWINGAHEIEGVISKKQSELNREMLLLHNEIDSIREKQVKGNTYLYRSVAGQWVYRGKKEEGNDARSRINDEIAEKEQELADMQAGIEASIIKKVPRNHLIVSEKFNGGILIKLGDIFSYPSRGPRPRSSMGGGKK